MRLVAITHIDTHNLLTCERAYKVIVINRSGNGSHCWRTLIWRTTTVVTGTALNGGLVEFDFLYIGIQLDSLGSWGARMTPCRSVKTSVMQRRESEESRHCRRRCCFLASASKTWGMVTFLSIPSIILYLTNIRNRKFRMLFVCYSC